MSTPERELEEKLIEKLRALKYEYRADIRDRASLEKNFRQKFETLNRVQLTDSEFQRLLDELVTPDVFTAARVIRERNDFTRDDGTPLAYTLVNIKDWCKKRLRSRSSAPDQHGLQPPPFNILSHGNYSLYEPQKMLEENKRYFRKILHDFIDRYPFNPALFPSHSVSAAAPGSVSPT